MDGYGSRMGSLTRKKRRMVSFAIETAVPLSAILVDFFLFKRLAKLVSSWIDQLF